MLRVPNFEIVIPVIPDVRLDTKVRYTTEGERDALEFAYVANSETVIELPWDPSAPEWVEVYIDGIRLINTPRQQPTFFPRSFEAYNVTGRIVKFSEPISGNLKFICDTKGSHWWGGLKVPLENIQVPLERKEYTEFLLEEWPIQGGTVVGRKYKVNYKPGATFYANSNVQIYGCEPNIFNGFWQISSSDAGAVYFESNVLARTSMIKNGTISGVANVTLDVHVSNGLYSEPVILTQPYNGYARLSTDRRTIVYVPKIGFTGNDTFSWTMMTQHGQVGIPKCCYVKVRRK